MSDIDKWYAYVQLTNRYAFALDLEEGRGAAELFVSDGVWDARDLDLGKYEGHDGLRSYFAREQGRPEAMSHLYANHEVFDSIDTTMRARSYVQGVVVIVGKDTVRHDVVLYDDELTLVGNDWRFARRTLRRVLGFGTTRAAGRGAG